MAWLTDVLERVVSERTKANELHTSLPGTDRSGWPRIWPHPNLPWPRDLIIDHPDRVERLLGQLGAVLPIPARPTPELPATLRGQRNAALPMDCRRVT